MTGLVNITIRDHIADVRLNRPDKMNALNPEMFEAITEAGKSLAGNRDVRAVVLSGEGKVFCAGLDLANFNNQEFASDPFGSGRGGSYPNFYQSAAWIWKSVPVPVICALHGVAFGGGLQIALGADIRIAEPDLKISVMEIKWGLIPDMAASQTLRDLVALDVAKELTFSGRIVEANEAKQLGLVTRIEESARDTALAMAGDIAQKNPDAVCAAKYLLETAWHGDWPDGLALEEYLQAQVMEGKNFKEAVTAAVQQRRANFSERTFKDFSELKKN